MTVLMAIPAELAGTSADFVRDWNSDPESIDVAVAAVPAEGPPTYSVDLINTVLVAFTGASVKTTIDLIIERLRQRHSRSRTDEKITYRTTHLDDGTEVTEIIIGK